jgi:hypothetical protein
MRSISETWGTTVEERLRSFPCDQIMAQPDATLYRGVTVYASLPDSAERCRLLVKLIARYSRGVYGKVMGRLLAWGDLIMMRRQLLNLK